MKKLSISKNELHIKDISIVTDSKMTFRGTNHVKGRNSDGFIFVLEGGCEYSFDDGTHFFVKEGDVLYLAFSSVYKMVLTEQIYSVIYFNFRFDADGERQSAVYAPSEAYGVKNLFKRMLRTYRSTDENYFCECLSLAYKIYGAVISSENTSYVERASREKIRRAKNYIDRNYSDPTLSVKSLAHDAGVSEVYFRRLFKSVIGTSPAKYINSTRLSKAEELMRTESYGIAECARETGFSTPQYFCRAFKSEYGASPVKYVKKQI